MACPSSRLSLLVKEAASGYLRGRGRQCGQGELCATVSGMKESLGQIGTIWHEISATNTPERQRTLPL